MGHAVVTVGPASGRGARAGTWPEPSVRWLAAAFACGVVLLFYHLGGYGLWDPDEGRHAEIAREMFAGTGLDRWVLLTFNGSGYHDKPVLYYWLTSLAYAFEGVSALSARLVSASAGTGVLAMTLWWARRHWGNATAIAATLVLASTVEFIALGRYGDLNMLLTFWITAGILATHTWAARGGRGWGLVVAAVAAGGGTLTKGFVAPVLIGATAVGYLTLRGELALLRVGPILRAGAVYAMVTLPWFVAAGVLDPAYLRDFLIEHHVHRFVGGGRHLHPKPFVFTPLMTLGAFLPWSLLLPAVARRAFGRRVRGAAADLCSCWAACVVAFFTFSSGKLGTYVLPAMVPLALLTGRFLATVPYGAAASIERRWADRALLLVGGLFVVTGPALVWLAYARGAGVVGSASWRILILGAVGVTIVWLARAGRTRRAAGAVALGTMASALVFYGTVAPQVSRLASDADLARAIRAADPAGTVPVVAYRARNASLLFHLGRTVPRLDVQRKLAAKLASEPTTFIVTRPAHLEGLSEGLTLLAGGSGGGHAVYVHRRRE